MTLSIVHDLVEPSYLRIGCVAWIQVRPDFARQAGVQVTRAVSFGVAVRGPVFHDLLGCGAAHRPQCNQFGFCVHSSPPAQPAEPGDALQRACSVPLAAILIRFGTAPINALHIVSPALNSASICGVLSPG
jgi:hypothetical protein